MVIVALCNCCLDIRDIRQAQLVRPGPHGSAMWTSPFGPSHTPRPIRSSPYGPGPYFRPNMDPYLDRHMDPKIGPGSTKIQEIKQNYTHIRTTNTISSRPWASRNPSSESDTVFVLCLRSTTQRWSAWTEVVQRDFHRWVNWTNRYSKSFAHSHSEQSREKTSQCINTTTH